MTEQQKDLGPVWLIGDSHVSAFAVDGSMIPEFPVVVDSTFAKVRACRLGPQLAGTLHRETSTTGGRAKALALIEQIPTGACVFFLFGEIDCRAHIVSRARHMDSRIQASVADTIANYMAFVDEFRSVAGPDRYLLGVVAPPPSSATLDPSHGHFAEEALRRLAASLAGRRVLRISRNFLSRKSALRQAIGLSLNYAGTEPQRRQAGQFFANQLEQAAADRKLAFIDMHTPFLTEENGVSAGWYWDAIHLRQAAVSEIAPQFEGLGIYNFSGFAAPERLSAGLGQPITEPFAQ